MIGALRETTCLQSVINENVKETEAAIGGSVKKGVLKNFAKFARKYLCQSRFFNKVAVFRPFTLLKKRLTRVFSTGVLRNF